MPYPTPIEWTDATWNPIGGCSIKSPGCAPCYAQRLAGTRLKSHPLYAGTTDVVKGKYVFNGHLTAAAPDHPVWQWPLAWRGAKNPKLGPGMPSLIFVGDMSDLAHEGRPLGIIDRVVGTIIRSAHIGQLLTKRPDVMEQYFRRHLADLGFFMEEANLKLWLGASAERQKEFDERWPHLRRLAAMGFIIFVSYEPALGPLKLPDDFLALGQRAQVIAGGMSGPEARYSPSNPDWFRRVRDQCASAGVPYFHKQNGEWVARNIIHVSRWHAIFANDRPIVMRRGKWGEAHQALRRGAEVLELVGRKAAGRLLDGREHNEFPAVAA